MAKTKPGFVKIKKGTITKDIPVKQWKAYGSNTYGWKLASDISDDIKNKEKQIEASQVSELQTAVKTLTGENDSLKAEIAEKDKVIASLDEQIQNLSVVNTNEPDVKEEPKAKAQPAPKSDSKK